MNSKAIVSRYKTVFSEPPKITPADHAVDGPLMGNGDILVALSGTGDTHRFHLGKNDFWRLQHAYGKSCPVPIGALTVRIEKFENPSYRVEQDLYTATTKGVFKNSDSSLTTRSYVAATRNLLFLEMAVTGDPLSVRASLSFSGDRGAETSTGRTDNVFWGTRAFLEDVDIATAVAAAWTLRDGGRPDCDGAFMVSPGKPVTLVLALDSLFKHKDYLGAAIENLSKTEPTRDAHEAWWANYWDRSYVSIGIPEIEKQYYMSLYGLGSCSRDPEFPPSIFGWVTTDSPRWNGDYHLNYNHQAPFYGLARANRLEQADPHDAPILDFMGRAAWHCREMYGFEGGMFPAGIGPKGIETTYNAERFRDKGLIYMEHDGLFFGQRSNGSYCLVNMAQRWYTTLDPEYGGKIYPFVLQMATFWENYLKWEPFKTAQDGKNGRFVIENDSCHEGSGADKNSCVTLALCRLAMTLAMSLSEALNADPGRRDAWANILGHLSDASLQTRDGRLVFRYTEEGMDWCDDNSIGIQHIYPGGQIHIDSDSDQLEIGRNTIDSMQRWHDWCGSNSFFPAATRIGYDPSKILHELRRYSEQTYPNGFRQDNPHGIENLSTVPNTINEMFCMGHEGVLRVFPVWPKETDAAFKHLRCWGAFLVSAALSNGVVKDLEIVSEKGSDCTLINPWSNRSTQIIRNGERSETLGGERSTFSTTPGEVIEIRPVT